jgi:hypothetical protein
MTPEFKQKWIEALRSGKYQQAREVLKDGQGGMCCLGVAADLIDSSKWSVERDRGGGFGWGVCRSDQLAEIAEAIGIALCDAKNLASRNDGTDEYRRHSFEEIARLIEQRIVADEGAPA